MPFVLLVVMAFGLGLVLDKGPGPRTYVLLFVSAIAATLYYMR